jgi:hypothetical protein
MLKSSVDSITNPNPLYSNPIYVTISRTVIKLVVTVEVDGSGATLRMR